jgi:preprotein translocase subunit YajC
MTGLTSFSMLLQAAPAAAAEPPAYLTFLPLVGMAIIFWFFILRPQMKQQKEHRRKIEAMQKGDQVVTAGGLIGKVVKLDETYVELELGPNVKVKAVRSTIGDIIPPAGSKPAND